MASLLSGILMVFHVRLLWLRQSTWKSARIPPITLSSKQTWSTATIPCRDHAVCFLPIQPCLLTFRMSPACAQFLLAGQGVPSQSGNTLSQCSLRNEKDKFTLFGDHNGSLLRQQPGANADSLYTGRQQRLSSTVRCVECLPPVRSSWLCTMRARSTSVQ